MKESNCYFTCIKSIWCKECHKEVLHETGINLVTKEKVKMCIHCDKITITGKGEKDGKVNK